MAEDGREAWYRLNAEKCLELANTFNDPESKRALLVMANAWLMLAAQRNKNSETILVYEMPSPVDEPPKPLSIKEPPPVNEPTPQRSNSAEPDDPMQC